MNSIKDFIFLFSFYFMLFTPCCKESKLCDEIKQDHFELNNEVDFNLLISKEDIFFCKKDSVDYKLLSLKNTINKEFIRGRKPFEYRNHIVVLKDSMGNDMYQPNDTNLIRLTKSRYIKDIYSFKGGEILVIEYLNDSGIYLLKPNEKAEIRIGEFLEKINGVLFDTESMNLLISFDNHLILYNILSYQEREIANNIRGEKLNPFLYGSYVYFVNNDTSEYLQLFKTNIAGKDESSLVLSLDNDICLPKVKNNILYFIEIKHGEYLLKKKCFITNEIESITNNGVVYNYDFYKDSTIAIVYANINTPRELFLYSEPEKSMITGSEYRFQNHIEARFITSLTRNSSAYILKDTISKIKGIILYIHPDIHSNFSPRWDALLMNLCKNGYMIVAPNYPMSSGFGKSFFNSTILQAFADIISWKEYICTNYYGFPLYCMSVSSGNILMEALLLAEPENIKGAVSLFGVPGTNEVSKCNVPTLYFLGKNDIIVDYTQRLSELDSFKKESLFSTVSYYNEGHGLRQEKNIKDALNKILNHFCLN